MHAEGMGVASKGKHSNFSITNTHPSPAKGKEFYLNIE
jgi:hypothetical protein